MASCEANVTLSGVQETRVAAIENTAQPSTAARRNSTPQHADKNRHTGSMPRVYRMIYIESRMRKSSSEGKTKHGLIEIELIAIAQRINLKSSNNELASFVK